MLIFKFLYRLAPACFFHFIARYLSSQILHSYKIEPLLPPKCSSLYLLVLSCHLESSIALSLPRKRVNNLLVLYSLVPASPNIQGLPSSALLRTSPVFCSQLSYDHLSSFTCSLAIRVHLLIYSTDWQLLENINLYCLSLQPPQQKAYCFHNLDAQYMFAEGVMKTFLSKQLI